MHDITERKQAEAALRESEERFRNMADMAPVMIWVSGPDKLGTFFNKAWLDFTGRTMGQELGEGWISGVHPDDLDHCLSTCSTSFDARRAFQIEFRLRRADGEYRWIVDSGVPRYRHGEFMGFIGSCLDVTERQLIEERLRGSETRLKDAQRLARIGSWERDVESGNAHWSDEMFRIYGLPNAAPCLFGFLELCLPGRPVETLKSPTSPFRCDPGYKFQIIRARRELRCLRTILNAVRNDSGAVVQKVGNTTEDYGSKRAQGEVLARQVESAVRQLAVSPTINNLWECWRRAGTGGVGRRLAS